MADTLMPLPGTRVIPVGWSAHHRPTVEGTWTATCLIDKAGTGPSVWNPVTHSTDPPPRIVLYDNLGCRVQQRTMPQQDALNAEQQVSTHEYLVVVDIKVAGLEIDGEHQVLIKTNPDDPDMAGRRLTVTDIQRGSLMWERDLVCIDNLG